MTHRLTKWVVVALVAGGALASNKEVACKKDCEEVGKLCTDSCKEQMKKKAPEVASYCAPKCAEIRVSCDKECENETKQRNKKKR